MCISPTAALTAKAPSLIPINTVESDKHYHAALRKSNDNVERLRHQRKQAFLAQQPEFQQLVNIDKIRCPLHILKFRQAFHNLAFNETLKIASVSTKTIEDLSAVCRILKISIKTLSYRGQYFLYASRLKKAKACLHQIPAQLPLQVIAAKDYQKYCSSFQTEAKLG